MATAKPKAPAPAVIVQRAGGKVTVRVQNAVAAMLVARRNGVRKHLIDSGFNAADADALIKLGVRKLLA